MPSEGPWIATGKWRYEARGGYGTVIYAPVRFVRRTAKRILVEVMTIGGTPKLRWIKPDNYLPFTEVRDAE